MHDPVFSALPGPGDFCVQCDGVAGSLERTESHGEHSECQDQAKALLWDIGSFTLKVSVLLLLKQDSDNYFVVFC